jgi:hypothetical protein
MSKMEVGKIRSRAEKAPKFWQKEERSRLPRGIGNADVEAADTGSVI